MKVKHSIVCLIILTGCVQRQNHLEIASLRDSIIERYISDIKSQSEFDTTDVNYQILKAYLSNNVNQLLAISKQIDIQKNERELFQKKDSILHLQNLHLQKLDTVGVIESYRFDYWEAFCNNQYNITILKTHDSVHLHFVIYQPKMILKSEYVIVDEYDKSIRLDEWNVFSNLIEHSDFWGLKATNDVMGFDGDGLTVIGFKQTHRADKNVVKNHRVYRWLVSSSTLADSYNYLFKIAGGKDTCIINWQKPTL